MFSRFIEECSFVSDKDASLAFFDECVDKVRFAANLYRRFFCVCVSEATALLCWEIYTYMYCVYKNVTAAILDMDKARFQRSGKHELSSVNMHERPGSF